MSSKSKEKISYKDIVKNCKSLQSANVLLAALLLRRLKKKKKVIKQEKKTEVLCCRTCLGTDQLEPIFGEEADEKKSEELMFATGLEIQKDDGLPQTICLLCSKNIKDNMIFREECKKSETKLLTWGFQKDTGQPSYPTAELMPVIKTEKDLFIDNWEGLAYVDSSEQLVKEYSIPENYDDAVYDNGIEDYIDQDYAMANESKVSLKPKKSPSKMKRQHKLSAPPFKCHICKKVLANASSLRSHVNWHTGQTAYICETCGKRCMNRTAFLQHMKGKHGLQRTDKCSYCDYMALNKEQLKIHERRHTGERPYICHHCGSGFHRRANLVQHLPIHLAVKTVQCDLCPSTFKSAKFLATHKSRAHSTRQYTYVCHLCNTVYKKSFNVRKHLAKVHAVPRDQQGAVLRVRVRAFGDSVGDA